MAIMAKKKICIMLTDAGHGHRASANAIADVLKERSDLFDVNIVNVYQEIWHPFDWSRKLLNTCGEEIYNKLQRIEATALCWPLLTPIMKCNLRFHMQQGIDAVTKFCQKEQPDLMLSVMPFVNRHLFYGLKKYKHTIPFVTLITDLDQCSGHQWIEPDLEQHCICGTDRLYEQIGSLEHKANLIHRTSGMVINKEFCNPTSYDIAAERSKNGLFPDYKTALIMFGGNGSKAIIPIAEKINKYKRQFFQAIFICGHNKKLFSKISNMPTNYPKLVVGFTKDIPYYMNISDFFIGKPGPGSISEALAKELPVIINSNYFTIKQEKFAKKWLETNGIGIAIKSFRHINSALDTLLNPKQFIKYKNSIARLPKNNAVFEVADVIEKLMKLHAAN